MAQLTPSSAKIRFFSTAKLLLTPSTTNEKGTEKGTDLFSPPSSEMGTDLFSVLLSRNKAGIAA
jgi:hypothetical protein